MTTNDLSAEKMAEVRNKDHLVLSAFNACLDLEKFKALPSYIQNRAISLLKHHRAKPVCFFDKEGFGLRVYLDKYTGESASDEYRPAENSNLQLDEDGHWIRCPKTNWEKFIAQLDPTNLNNDWIVMRAVDSKCVLNYSSDNLDDVSTPYNQNDRRSITDDLEWTSSEFDAVRMTRTEANKLTTIINLEPYCPVNERVVAIRRPKPEMNDDEEIVGTITKNLDETTDPAANEDEDSPQPAPEAKYVILRVNRSGDRSTTGTRYVRSIRRDRIPVLAVPTIGQHAESFLAIQWSDFNSPISRARAAKFTEEEARQIHAKLTGPRRTYGSSTCDYVIVLV